MAFRRGIAIFAFPLMLVVASCGEKHHLPMQSSTMSAQALHAGGFAYQAFLAYLAKESGPDEAFVKFVATPDNYDVEFREHEDAYSYTFKLRPYDGHYVKDGWVTFDVRKADGAVARAQYR